MPAESHLPPSEHMLRQAPFGFAWAQIFTLMLPNLLTAARNFLHKKDKRYRLLWHSIRDFFLGKIKRIWPCLTETRLAFLCEGLRPLENIA